MPHKTPLSEEDREETRGLTVQVCIGRNGGLHITLNKNVLRISLWFISFSIFTHDMELMISRAIRKGTIRL